MAQTIAEIKQGMIDSIQSNDNLKNDLNNDSKESIYHNIVYIVAIAVWIQQKLFDKLKGEVLELLARLRPHTPAWYVEKAKAFQLGHKLIPGKDYYEVQDTDAQIITHASATEVVTEIKSTLYLKVAKRIGDDLVKLNESELVQFNQYIKQIKDAGVKIIVISDVGDDLRTTIDVWYNPLVLDAFGKLLTDTSQEPAKDALKHYICNLPFNGEFVPTHMIDAIQLAKGVAFPVIKSIESRFGTNEYSVIYGKTVPNAGYLVITDDNLTLNYIANV